MAKNIYQKTNDEPSVTIVILNWNGLADTLACLKSLKQVHYKNLKIVVIDNGSEKDEAGEIIAKYPELKLIKNKTNLGFTGGCNQGMDEAIKSDSKYVVLLNNDTQVEPNFLRKTVDFYEAKSDAGMVSPLILYTDHKRIMFGGAKIILGMIRHLRKGENVDSAKLPKVPFKTDYVPGTALLISTELINKIGKLDDRYFAYYEDLDWCWKAQKRGFYSYVVPDAVVYHKKSGSTSEGGFKKWNKTPSYYVARNSILLSSNFKSIHKTFFILAQIFIKLPLNMIMLVNPNAWSRYIKGTFDGLNAITKQEN